MLLAMVVDFRWLFLVSSLGNWFAAFWTLVSYHNTTQHHNLDLNLKQAWLN